MLYLRLVTPSDLTADVLAYLQAHVAATNITFVASAALQPEGDLVTCDLAREGVNDVIAALRERGVDQHGSIALEHIDVSVSKAAAEAELRAPGYGSDAAVWEEVDARVRDESYLTVGFVVFLVVAALIAAIGLIEDSSILVVGAMVVGPEFGPIAGLAVGLFKRRPARIRVAGSTLAVGFAAGIVATYLVIGVAELAGWVPDAFSPETQPITGFVTNPSFASFAISFLAGIAGTLSLTQARSGALIGVLISVTTIPAVAAVGVSAAVGEWDDALGALVQLTLNVVGLVLAGVVTLWVQREAWERVKARR